MSADRPIPRRPQVVDAWIQPWTKEIVDGLPWRTANVFKRYGESAAMHGISLEQMMEEMDASPVDLALVSGGPVMPNSVVLECLDRWSDRLIGVVAVDPSDGVMKAVRELESLARDYPICAMKLEPFYHWTDPTHRMFYPLYAKCEELGLAVQTQVGGTGPYYPSRSGQPLYIDEVALDFPDLTIVCGHVGTPWAEEMIHVAWKHENIFIDTSARLPKHFEPGLLTFLTRYGQDRCIYASDWPLLDMERPLRQVEDLNLTEEVRRKFLAENAIRAFRLERFIADDAA